MLLKRPVSLLPRANRFLQYIVHRWRRILFFVCAVWVFTVYANRKHPFLTHPHEITAHDISFESVHPPVNIDTNSYLPLPTARSLCSAHRWSIYPRREARRKVYDFVIVDGEGDLDWLEIRLDGMGGHVDYFIIAEGALTGDGEGIVRRNWDRFERWHKKIVLFVLEEEPAGQRREDFQRNAMFLKAMSTIEGEKKPRRGDVLIIANVDEIVRPAALLVLRNCDFPKRVTLRSRLYYYGFQWLHRGEEWAYPQATSYQGGDTILPADLRNGDGGNRMVNWWDKADFWNAGWHCRFCFKTIEDMLDKMASLSDMGLNKEAFRNRMRIVDRVRKGLDLWDTESEGFERIEASDDIPEMVLKQREKFGYLLNRDGPNAGFVDMGAGELTAD